MEKEPKYPRQVSFSDSADSPQWVLQEEFVVRTACDESTKMPNEVMRMSPGVAICQTTNFNHEVSEPETTVAYRLGGDGPIGVPTGRLFVRISKSESYKSLVAQMSELGFNVQQKSPTGLWLEHESGKIARSLSEFTSLSHLPQILSVQPQFEMTKSNRSGRR